MAEVEGSIFDGDTVVVAGTTVLLDVLDAAACISGIDSVKKNASEKDRYRRTSTPDGRFRFGLDAANGQSIAGSRHYQTAGARDDGIEFVMKNAPDAKMQDLT